MITLQKNIYTEKNGDRPRLVIPKQWILANGKSVYLLQDDDFIIIVPIGKDINKLIDKIKKTI